MSETPQAGPVNVVAPQMPQVVTPQISVSDMTGAAVDAGGMDPNAATYLAMELGPIPGVNTEGIIGPGTGILQPEPVQPAPIQPVPGQPAPLQPAPVQPIVPVATVPEIPGQLQPQVQGVPAPRQVVLRAGEQLMEMPGGQFLVVDAMGVPQQPQYAQQDIPVTQPVPEVPEAPGPQLESGQEKAPQWEFQIGSDGQPVMGQDGKPVVVQAGGGEASMEKFQETMTKLMSGLESRREHELILQNSYKESLKKNDGVRSKALSKFKDIATVADMAPDDLAGLIATMTDQATSSSYAREANDTRMNDLAGHCAEQLATFAKENNISNEHLNEVLEAGGGLGQSVDPVRVTRLMTLALAGQASMNGVRLSASKAALAASIKAKQLVKTQGPIAGGAMRVGDGQAGMVLDGRTIPQSELNQYGVAAQYGSGGGGVPNVTDLFVELR